MPTFRVLLISIVLLLPWYVYGQQDAAQSFFSQPEIEQLVAPIALYPDPLLAQILMASTYPLEVVSAARWRQANPDLKDKALEDALQQQPWDASVKSLTAVPDVLNMLNEQLDMTQKLGDAFLAQQKDVLDAVQRLRNKAQAAGNLQSNQEQVIDTAQDNGSPTITIEPTDPQVVSVPYYDPSTIYGDWPYPSYPPYFYNPNDYDIGSGLLYFGAGLAVGNALWGGFNWHNGYLNINPNRYNSFNRANINNTQWQHDPAHRGGVQYAGSATQQRFGGAQLQNNAAREAFSGRAEQGRQEIARGASVNQITNHNNAVQNLSNQPRNRVEQFQPLHANVYGGNQARAGTFEGIHNGAETRNFSNRGAYSRASAISHAPSVTPRSGGGFHGGGAGHSRGGRQR